MSRFAVGFLTGATLSVTVLWWWNRSSCSSSSPTRSSKDDNNNEEVDSSHAPFSLSLSAASTERNNVPSSKNFLSDIVQALWSHINAFLSTTIRETIEPMLAESLPQPLSTMRFTKFSLGTNPIHFEHIVVHKETTFQTETKSDHHHHDGTTSPAVVKLDMDVMWEANCQIELKADYVGTLGIQKIVLKGRLGFLLHPMNESPIVSAIQFSLINPPDIELDFTGLAQLADIGIVKRRIVQTIQDSLALTMVLPQRMLVKLDPCANYVDLYAPPRGIVRFTLKHGNGFQIEKRLFGKDDVADVYCTVSLGNKTWTSSTIDNKLDPVWNESVDFLWNESEQRIVLNAWDSDKGALDADDHLGYGQITVGQVLHTPNRTVQIELQANESNSTKTGASITFSIEVLSLTNDMSSLKSFTPHQMSGLVEILVLCARDLPVTRKDAASRVKAACGSHQFETSIVVDAPGVDGLTPVYDASFLVPIETQEDCKDVTFTLYNAQTVLGSHTVTVASILQTNDKSVMAQQAIGEKGAILEYCVCLRGIQAVQDGQALTSNTARSLPTTPQRSRSLGAPESKSKPPKAKNTSAVQRPRAGSIRLIAVKGYGFKVQRRRFRKADIPDVYCKVQCGDPSNIWRTKTVRDSVNPQWNESNEFPLYDTKDAVIVDVYDEDGSKFDADDFIGSGRIAIGKLLADSKSRPVDLAIKKEGKGTVAFVALQAEQISRA